MADPLLTTLCTVCHISTPKYTCPRCGVRSCSLACLVRHKQRAPCSGIRDVTAYVPRSRLQTPRMVDHDYNFLHGIDVARRTSERQIIDERGLFRDGAELGQGMRKHWVGEELRFVPALEDIGRERRRAEEEESSVSKKKIRGLCRAVGIEVVAAPRGMSRQKENATAWNKRTRMINWQVEWCVYEDGSERRPTRILKKALDGVPIYKAFGETMESVVKGLDMQGDEDQMPPRKKRRRTEHHGDSSVQDPRLSIWTRCSYPCQNPFSGAWDVESGSEIRTWERDAEIETKQRFQYFLFKHGTNPKQLIPVESLETLTTILSGRTIHEFPTIYVLPPGEKLPPDYALGSTERRKPEPEKEPQQRESRPDRKRKHPGSRDKQSGPNGILQELVRDVFSNGESALKKRKVAFAAVQDIDEGEINSEGEALQEPMVVEDSTTSTEGSPSEEDASDGSSSISEGEIEDESHNHAKIGPGVITGKGRLVMYDSESD